MDPESVLWRGWSTVICFTKLFAAPINVMDGVTTTPFDDAVPAASGSSPFTRFLLPKKQYDALFEKQEHNAEEELGYPFYLPEYPSVASHIFHALEGLFRAQLPGGALNAAGPDALFPRDLIFGNAYKAIDADKNKYPAYAGSMDRFYPFHFSSYLMYSTSAKLLSLCLLCVSGMIFAGLMVVNPVVEGRFMGPNSKLNTGLTTLLLGLITLSVCVSVLLDVVSIAAFALAPAAIRRQRLHNGDNAASSLLKAGAVALNQTISTCLEPLLTGAVLLGAMYYRVVVDDYAKMGSAASSSPGKGGASSISDRALFATLGAFALLNVLSVVLCRVYVKMTVPKVKALPTTTSAATKPLQENGNGDDDGDEVVFVDARIEGRVPEILRTPDVEVVSEGDGSSVRLRAVATTFQAMWEAGDKKDTRGLIDLPRAGDFSDGIERVPSNHNESILCALIPMLHKAAFGVAMLVLFVADSSALSHSRSIQAGPQLLAIAVVATIAGQILVVRGVLCVRNDFWRAASGWRRAQLEWAKTRIINVPPHVLKSNVFHPFAMSWAASAFAGTILGLAIAVGKYLWDTTQTTSGFSWLIPGLSATLVCVFLCGLLSVVAIIQCSSMMLCVAHVTRATGTPMFRPVVNIYLDGVYDLCHVGHKKMFQHALSHADRVLVGVMSDEDCVSYKRRPVMSTAERMREILNTSISVGGKSVFRVLPHSPNRGIPLHTLVRYGITKVLMGQEYVKDSDIYYIAARLLARMTQVAPRTGGISTSDIIKRIQGTSK